MISMEKIKETAKNHEGLEFTQADVKYAFDCDSDGEARDLLNTLIKDGVARRTGKKSFYGYEIYIVISPETTINEAVAKVISLISVNGWDIQTAVNCIYDTIYDIVAIDAFIGMVKIAIARLSKIQKQITVVTKDKKIVSGTMVSCNVESGTAQVKSNGRIYTGKIRKQ